MGKDFDEINYWSEVKLDIVREYAATYSKILSAQSAPRFHHLYIDGFAGAGFHLSRSTGEFVAGSPLNALLVTPRFQEYHFVDLNSGKAEALRALTKDRADVTVHEGDANRVLLEDVFPRADYARYRRALCLLDPYGLHLNWQVIQTAGQMRTIEIFLNFPTADMNRNVLWRNPEKVKPAQIERMTAFWGDDSWREVAYDTTRNMFGWEVKTDNDTIAEAFQERLKNVASFRFVPAPLPMRNSKGAVIYYLFFASHNPVADHIVKDIFETYRTRGG